MNTTGPPHGGVNSGAGAPPPAPVAVQQTTVIQVGGQKSVVGAVLLAFFFGPLGMLYATVPGALIMFVVSFPILFFTLGLGLIITLPACAIWAGIAANSHNTQLQGVSSMQAVGSRSTVSPAGWHDDPGGSGRLRYYDGMRWTDHYADATQQQEPAADQPAKQLEPASASVEAPTDEQVKEPEEQTDEAEADEVAAEAPTAVVSTEAQRVFCGACGQSITATARFCPACGETQATA